MRGHAGPASGAKAGVYHLGCYIRSKTASTLKSAKSQCISAFSKATPACKGEVVSSGSKQYGCDSFVVYMFTSQVCYDARW